MALERKGEVRPRRLASVVLPDNMLEFLEEGGAALRYAGTVLSEELPAGARRPDGATLVYAPERVRLLAPIPEPPSLRDFYAFEDHVKAGFEKRGEPMPREWYEMPVYYKGGHRTSWVRTRTFSGRPSLEKFDYELELAIVIGKKGRNIKASDAREYIAGFTVMNDFSARDIQKKEMKVRLGPARERTGRTGLGPCLVTPDELGDPYNLEMTARVNGEVWSQGNSRSSVLEVRTDDRVPHEGRHNLSRRCHRLGNRRLRLGPGVGSLGAAGRRDGTGDREDRRVAESSGSAMSEEGGCLCIR